MTVATGTVKDVLYLRRHLRMRCDSLRCVNRRVRSRRPFELYEDEKADDHDQYPLDYLAKGLHVCLWCLLRVLQIQMHFRLQLSLAQ